MKKYDMLSESLPAMIRSLIQWRNTVGSKAVIKHLDKAGESLMSALKAVDRLKKKEANNNATTHDV